MINMKNTKGEMKKDFDISPRLDDPLQKGEAVVWYLGHSGWAIKTKNFTYVFGWKTAYNPGCVYLAGPRGKTRIRDVEVYHVDVKSLKD